MTSAARRLVVVAALAVAPAAARADRWRGGGSLALDLRYAQYEVDDAVVTRALTGGPRARAAVGTSALALAAGVDLGLGASGDGDLVYRVALLPIGAALQLGRTARLGFVAGGAIAGITGGTLPIAFALPVEAFAEISLGDHVRSAAWGRASPLYGSDRRQAGAPDAPFGDELEIGLTLRWDRRRSEHGFASGNGYQLGATYGQEAGADVLGLLFGYSLDAAGPD